jgi:hypothetical protein
LIISCTSSTTHEENALPVINLRVALTLVQPPQSDPFIPDLNRSSTAANASHDVVYVDDMGSVAALDAPYFDPRSG